MKIAIDCRELTRERIVSVGHCLTSILPHWERQEILQLSDIPLSDTFRMPKGRNLCYGRTNRGRLDVIRYQRWMKRVLEKEKPDVLFQINHYSIFPIQGVKIVTVIHDLYAIEGLERFNPVYRRMFAWMIRRTLRCSDVVVAISRYTKSRIEANFGRHENVRVIYNGVDNLSPGWASADPPLVCGRYILVLGRLNYWKGTERLLFLYKNYLADSGYLMVFAGLAENERMRGLMQAACRDEPNLRWLDYVTNGQRENLYRNAALVCYASRFDGFGSPPLEAALRGTRCLINDIPVLREVTQNLGYYVDYYRDDRAAVSAILNALRDKNDRKDRALFELARQYTWEACARSLMEIFREIVRPADR